MRPRTHRLAVLAALVAALAAPATARADAFGDVFADFQTDGKIDPCKHSQGKLRDARGDIPNDIEQYAPDFPAALDAALEDRAKGRCERGGGGGGGNTGGGGAPGAPGGSGAPPPGAPAPAPGAPGAAPGGGTPAPPASFEPAPPAADGAVARAAAAPADDGSDAPAPVLLLAILAGLLALALLLWGAFRFFAWEPRWLLAARHATAEAGWRAGGAWADFTDWVRSRREPSSPA
jgi:hypothetical protein